MKSVFDSTTLTLYKTSAIKGLALNDYLYLSNSALLSGLTT